MFSPDTEPFRKACFCLYGRTHVRHDNEVKDVIEVIKRRRTLLANSIGDDSIYKNLMRNFGMGDPKDLSKPLEIDK